MQRQRDTARPGRRVVLVGASNLARSISTIVETARLGWGEPVEILAALGHGRSFGQESSIFTRKLSGIIQCGLWPALASAPARPTTALVTDIGNDILYGASVEAIVGWVATCFDRLSEASAQTIVTELPVGNLRGLSTSRFRFLRSLLFPACRLSMEQVVDAAHELNRRIGQLAGERQIRVIPLKNTWFGFDPIHIRRRHWPLAWREILGNWHDQPVTASAARGSLPRWLYLRLLTPEHRQIFGLTQRCRQPSGKLRNGTTIALY